jgi:hypothetical protein
MAFTEFCCRSGGSNLNAGTLKGDSTEPGTAASYTYASGDWVQSTGVFTVASGDPASDGVAVGDFASVYADGSTETGFVGRITARDATTITVSLTAKAGTAPTDGTGTRTLKVGGAWQGPNGSSAFPFNIAVIGLTNVAGDYPRINMSGTFNVTATISIAASVAMAGYALTYNDTGKATIDGSGSGSGFTLLSFGNRCRVQDIIGQNNGGSGNSNDIFAGTGTSLKLYRCSAKGARRAGFNLTGGVYYEECEAYDNGKGSGANSAGFAVSGQPSVFVRCISFNNSTSSTQHGFDNIGVSSTYLNCVAYGNSGAGFNFRSTSSSQLLLLSYCDTYSNNSGVSFATTSLGVGLSIHNSNFIKNTTYGIEASGANLPTMRGSILNCGFGSGTQANGTDVFGVSADYISDSVTYPVDEHPWVNPAGGDFTIALAQAKNAGRGLFTQTVSGYSGTTGYPDIGAAQSLAAGGSTLHPLYATGRK